MSLKPFALNALEAPSDETASVLPNSQTRQRQRILVVEDDAAIRQLTSQALIHAGFRVDTAEDGEEGWKLLHAMQHEADGYGLLITDNNMPRLSGLELVEKIRSVGMTVPVILATGTPPLNTGSLSMAAILNKPFSLDQLLQTVKEVLHWSTVSVNQACTLQTKSV